MKKVTDGDIGKKGSKIYHFCGDVIFEWPFIKPISQQFVDAPFALFEFSLIA